MHINSKRQLRSVQGLPGTAATAASKGQQCCSVTISICACPRPTYCSHRCRLASSVHPAVLHYGLTVGTFLHLALYSSASHLSSGCSGSLSMRSSSCLLVSMWLSIKADRASSQNGSALQARTTQQDSGVVATVLSTEMPCNCVPARSNAHCWLCEHDNCWLTHHMLAQVGMHLRLKLVYLSLLLLQYLELGA